MKKPPRTRVVALCNTKGGCGKSSLSAALAVQASLESKKVGLIDADRGQNSLSRWYELRGEPKNPRLLDADCSAEALGLIGAQGFEWLFLDTPPRGLEEISQAIDMAHFVLIPTLAAAFDVESTDQIVELCKRYTTPFAFVINAAQPRWKLTAEARLYLVEDGPVCETLVTYRRAYIAASTLGKTGAEIDKDGKCKEEISALWAEVKAFVNQSAKVR
jgi:chromosome partitioning protein